MAFSYTSVQPTRTFGGIDCLHNGSNLLSQCQHVIANDDVILVTMLLNRNIRTIDYNTGHFKCDVSEMGFSESKFEMAAGMCFHDDGKQILVTDLNANKIMSFKSSDLSFDRLLFTDTTFDKPNAICTDSRGCIYVGEVGDNSRKLRCFDAEFKEKFSISQAGGYDLLGVNYISYDKTGKRILLTDSVANAVHMYTDDGVYQINIGGSNGSGVGEFTYPTGAAFDTKGNILICDTGNSRVQVFDEEGKFISLFGDEESFCSPMDIHVHGDSEEIIIVDGSVLSGWSRVKIFKY